MTAAAFVQLLDVRVDGLFADEVAGQHGPDGQLEAEKCLIKANISIKHAPVSDHADDEN